MGRAVEWVLRKILAMPLYYDELPESGPAGGGESDRTAQNEPRRVFGQEEPLTRLADSALEHMPQVAFVQVDSMLAFTRSFTEAATTSCMSCSRPCRTPA